MESGADVTSSCKTTNDVTHLERTTRKFLLPDGVAVREGDDLRIKSSTENVASSMLGGAGVQCLSCGGRLLLNAGARRQQAALLAHLASVNRDAISPRPSHRAFAGGNNSSGGQGQVSVGGVVDLDLSTLMPNHFVAVDVSIGCPCCCVATSSTSSSSKNQSQDDEGDATTDGAAPSRSLLHADADSLPPPHPQQHQQKGQKSRDDLSPGRESLGLDSISSDGDHSDYGSLDTVLLNAEYLNRLQQQQQQHGLANKGGSSRGESIGKSSSGIGTTTTDSVTSPPGSGPAFSPPFATTTAFPFRQQMSEIAATDNNNAENAADRPAYCASVSSPGRLSSDGTPQLQQEQRDNEVNVKDTNGNADDDDSFEREFDKVLQMADDELNRAATAAVSAAKKKKNRVKTYEEMMANARARAAVNGKDDDQQLQHNDNNNWNNQRFYGNGTTDANGAFSLDELATFLDDLSNSLNESQSAIAGLLTDSGADDINGEQQPMAFDYSIFDEMESKFRDMDKDGATVNVGLIAEEDSGNTKVVTVSQKKARVVPDTQGQGRRATVNGHVVELNISDSMLRNVSSVQSHLAHTVKTALDSSTKRRVLATPGGGNGEGATTDASSSVKVKDEEARTTGSDAAAGSSGQSQVVKEEVIVLQEATLVLSYPKSKKRSSTLTHVTKATATTPLQSHNGADINSAENAADSFPVVDNNKPIREMLVKRHIKISDLPPAPGVLGSDASSSSCFTSVTSSLSSQG